MDQSEKQDRACINCMFFRPLLEEGGNKVEIIDDFCINHKVPDNDDKFCDEWEAKENLK